MTEPEERIARLSASVNRLAESVKGLRLEVEGWRTHTGSTGYFLLTAVEDLTKAVDELKGALR